MPEPETVWITSGAVAALFGVTPKTVITWANKGLIPCQVTPGGTRRFREHEIMPLVAKLAQATP